VDIAKKALLWKIFTLSIASIPVFAANKPAVTLIDPPVVYMIDIEPPQGANSANKGAWPLKACKTAPWDRPYIAVDAWSLIEEDVEWATELRNYKGRVLAESRFSSAEQVEQLMTLYKAAMEGNPNATAEIADRYFDGRGLPNHFKSSFIWYRKAAEFGSTYAMYVISELYGEGWIVEQDPMASARWYRRAQEQENALLGMRQLALRYAEHEGGMYHLDKAFFWAERAASQGDVPSQLWMGNYYADAEHLDGLLALKWYGKAAASREPQAYYGIAQLYDLGEGIPVDYAEAARWYEKAGRLGLNVAQYHLGMMYAKGRGVPYDPIRAWAWLEVSKGRFDNTKIQQVQHALIVDMLPEHRLYAADLAAEYTLFNTGPRKVNFGDNGKTVNKNKSKSSTSNKAVAKAKVYNDRD
jgi:TPR repeat protein